ncbi:pentatricopeptide repeat-containing protein At1g30610, chloroplastic [Lotus japonicus]|uniref:pentatricopeptide repeat-containing protein At1g30610, chloroplastic n=1 Tax=Lotus japonicus TaxID=34305 RepID=UPI00258E240E|nr:pentatricopeptide repeat-containing protein At1g30610, chloroplastic [Lotus japonicus]XP_057456871.1 pentatricopeptide repeat-containing protein At1g30610, chloroplastic [Lotus japonicus]
MGVVCFEINGNSASALHYVSNSFSSYAVPISSRPFFGNALSVRVGRKFQVSHTRKLNIGPVMVSLNGGSGSNAGSVSEVLRLKDMEFKPSFDEYLKAMESAKTGRGKKHAATQTQKKMKMGVDDGNKIFKRVGEKIDKKDDFEDVGLRVDEAVMDKEGSSTSHGKLRGGFKKEFDGKESNLDVKAKQKHGANMRQGEWLKRQSHSLGSESDDRSVVKRRGENGSGRISNSIIRSNSTGSRNSQGRNGSGGMSNNMIRSSSNGSRNSQGKYGSGRMSNNMIRSNSNGSRGSVIDRGVPYNMYSSKVSRDSGQRGGMSKNIIRSSSNGSRGSVIDRGVTHDLYSSKVSRDSRQRGGMGNNIITSSSNGSRGSTIDRGVTHDLYFSKVSRDSRQRGHNMGGDKIVASRKVMDRGLERKHIESESLVNRNGRVSSKRFLDRGYDSDNLEVERAAFKNLEDPKNVISKKQFSHKEMEEKIQTLAKSLNGADIGLPEWMFSQMMRSAKLKFNDYSITRVIILLGNLGNWRRVVQVIEWLQRRERFKSYKLRHIYTAALGALGKSKRPVEALNVFHAMLQQMSSYPDLVAYHSIAVTLGQAGHMKELFDVIDIMRSPPKKKIKTEIFENWDPRLEPDIVVYNAVLNACVKRKQWEGAFWVLQQLKKQNLQPCPATYGLVMEVMFSCGKYNLVHEFFRKLQKSSIPNSLTYRVLVNTFWKEGKTDEAISAVQEMETRGIVGSAAIYYDLARCLCAAGRGREALMQIDKICKVANKPLVVTYTGLMQASLDSGNIQDGAYIFEKMKEICAPNLVTYNIVLKAYLEHGMFQEAKELLEQMLENTNHLREKTDNKMRVIPDIYTFNTMLDACVAERRWDYFEYVYQRMLYHGYHFNPKRHLRMVLEASRAGKEGPLVITWKHLAATDRLPPVSLVKERFCVELEKHDHVAALTCIINYPPKDLEPFSKSSWLSLFKENSQRYQKDTIVRLINGASNVVSNSSLPNPILVCLMQSCKEFFFATDVSGADMDSVKNVFAVDSKLAVAKDDPKLCNINSTKIQ